MLPKHQEMKFASCLFLKSSTLQPLKLETSNFLSAKLQRRGQRCPLQWPPSVHWCSTPWLLDSWCRTCAAEPWEPQSPPHCSFRNKSYQAGFLGIPTWQNFIRFCVKLEVSIFRRRLNCFPLVGLLLDLNCLGQDIDKLKWQPAFGRTCCTNWCGVWRCRIGHCCCRTFGSFKAGIKGNGAQLWWIQTCGWWQAGAFVEKLEVFYIRWSYGVEPTSL